MFGNQDIVSAGHVTELLIYFSFISFYCFWWQNLKTWAKILKTICMAKYLLTLSKKKFHVF